MIPLLLLGGLLLGGALLATFWKDIVNWIKRGAEKILEKIKQVVVGVKIFVKKMNEAVKEISKHYSKNENQQWSETLVTREISESEVPKEILQKVKRSSSEVEISNELELQLN